MSYLNRGAMIAGLAFVLASSAFGQARLIGYGVYSCGTFLRSQSSGENVRSYEIWAQGYLSAANFEKGLGDGSGVSLENWDGIWILIENYCRENPLELFATSVAITALELRRRAGE